MKKVYVAITCFLIGTLFVILVRNSCEIERYWLAPERPPAGAGWENARRRDSIYLGEFVMNQGESTENDGIGVTVQSIQLPATCPAPNSFEGDGSQARIRFYRASDGHTLCEFSLEQDSTSYDLGRLCEAPLPFNRISIDGMNAYDGWVSFSLYRWDPTAE